MRSAGRLTFLAGGAVVLLAWLLGLTGLPEAYQPVTAVLAEVLAIVLLVLAMRFRRSRLAAAATIFALSNLLLRGPLSGPLTVQTGDQVLWSRPEIALLALALPLNLGVLAFLRDRSLGQLGAIVHLAAVALQPWLAYGVLALLRTDPSGHAISRPDQVLTVLRPPQAALLAFLIAGVFAVLALVLRRGSFEGSLLWALAASSLALLASSEIDQVTLLLSAAQLTLLIGLVEDSYRLAFHDELTGLPSRRALNDTMRTLRGSYAMAMIDVDRFKRFNDRYGHDAGDQALKMVADELARVSSGGRAFRYGGEEFTIVFSGKAPEEARLPLEQVRTSIEAKRFAIRSAERPRKKPKRARTPAAAVQHVTLTVSMGLAGPKTGRVKPEEVLQAADKALYQAKRKGRNRLIVSS